MAHIVGIDFGTTHSLIAIVKDGKPSVIPLKDGSFMLPSVVLYSTSQALLIGKEAQEFKYLYPNSTIFSIKRFMGEDMKLEINERKFSPEEMASYIIQELKHSAEVFLKESIFHAVISVPAYFDFSQRQAIKTAAEMAGLEVVRMINEPTAAALAYGYGHDTISQRLMICDLGGGTFDVSILEIKDGSFKVLSSSGDNELGGDDWDQCLISFFEKIILQEFGDQALSTHFVRVKLKENTEKLKCELSRQNEATISTPILIAQEYMKSFNYTMTREEYFQLTKELANRLLPPIKRALSDMRIKPSHIDRVIMVGGATRSPQILEEIHRFIGKIPYTEIDPDQVVSLGTALQAAMISQKITGKQLLDVTPLSFGIQSKRGFYRELIERNSTIPISRSRTFSIPKSEQTFFEIQILQGEKEFAKHHQLVGQLRLEGLDTDQETKIKIIFTIDINGMLLVSAVDLRTGKEKKAHLLTTKIISRRQIEGVLNRARDYVLQERKNKHFGELLIRAENLLKMSEKILDYFKDHLTDDFRKRIQQMIFILRKSLNSSSQEEIEKKVLSLSQFVQMAYFKWLAMQHR